MAGENHDALPAPPDLPDPIRKAMLAHAHIQAEASWWVFSIATYAAHPGENELIALGDQTRDFMDSVALVEQATKDVVLWIDKIMRERR